MCQAKNMRPHFGSVYTGLFMMKYYTYLPQTYEQALCFRSLAVAGIAATSNACSSCVKVLESVLEKGLGCNK